MKISAIDTEYKGYKFRSRLEARWAVFFDELQVEYQYEPEAFQLKTINYLLDFHLSQSIYVFNEELPRKNVWIEIKPPVELSESEKVKLSQFLKGTNYHLLLISGDPGIKSTKISLMSVGSNGEILAQKAKWIYFPNERLGLILKCDYDDISDPLKRREVNDLLKSPKLLGAYKKAKQYRFEHVHDRSNTSPYTKTCEDCGEEFIPRQNRHHICYDCYQYRMNRPASETPDSQQVTEPIKRNNKNRWLVLGLITLFIMIILGSAYLIFSSRSVSKDNLTTKLTPTPVCVCTSNQYNCGDFKNSNNAQECFDYCYADYGDVHYLDVDEDLIACEPKR